MSNDFNVRKYSDAPGPLIDGSDALAQDREMVISFKHQNSGKNVSFKAFIEAYTDTFNPDWSAESVYGRVDPIYLFKNTTRRISLTFKVPAATVGEAYENLGKVSKLTQFLYPDYKNVDQAQTIAQSPLVRLKVMNLLSNGNDFALNNLEEEAEAPTPRSTYELYTSSGSDAENGMLGWIGALTIDHNLNNPDAGAFMPIGKKNTILPKLIVVTMDFNPIHEIALGYEEAGTFKNELFPYGVALSPDELPSAPVPALSDPEASTPASEDNAHAATDRAAGTITPILEDSQFEEDIIPVDIE